MSEANIANLHKRINQLKKDSAVFYDPIMNKFEVVADEGKRYRERIDQFPQDFVGVYNKSVSIESLREDVEHLVEHERIMMHV